MSFRATISVRYAGKPAGIGYYRNWDDLHLLFEAVALAAAADCCPDVISYREMVRRADPGRSSEISDEEEDEVIRDLEEVSEYPIVVDAVSRRIRLEGSWPHAEQRKMFREQEVIRPTVDVTELLCGEGIPYTDEMLKNVREAVLDDEEMSGHFSVSTGRMIRYLSGGETAVKDGTAPGNRSIISQTENQT